MLDEYLYLMIALIYLIIGMVYLYELWHYANTKNYILVASYIGLFIFYVLLWRDHLALLLKLKIK